MNIGKWFLSCFVATSLVSASAYGVELSYRGWVGSANFLNGRFVGCHLDSTKSLSPPYDSIRIAAVNPLLFSMQFISRFEEPPPDPGSTESVRIAIVKGEQLLHEDWSGHAEYLIRILSHGTAADGKRITREALDVPSNDEFVMKLRDARYLKIYRPTNNLLLQGINFKIIDLRHHSVLDPKTWIGMLDANDTYGAIREVMACVNQYSTPVDGPTQALFNFEYALKAGPFRNAYVQLKEVGLFYCNTKNQFPYDPTLAYAGNVANAVNSAAVLYNQRAGNSSSADEISRRDWSMAVADRILCPGWPGYPRLND